MTWTSADDASKCVSSHAQLQLPNRTVGSESNAEYAERNATDQPTLNQQIPFKLRRPQLPSHLHTTQPRQHPIPTNSSKKKPKPLQERTKPRTW